MRHGIVAKAIAVVAALAQWAALASCSHPQDGIQAERGGTGRTLKVVNWNVETFFDSVTTGNEYDTFVKSERWGKEAYVERLKRLTAVIKLLDADVFVMEELENEGILYDISNFLAGEWDAKKRYPYACFAKDEGSAIGCGVLSRHELGRLSVHAVDIRTEPDAMPRMRPLMQVTVRAGGGDMVLLVSHWKSMLGGEEQTERWRAWQESVLSARFGAGIRQGKALLACGDYNRDLLSFQQGERAGTVTLRNRLNPDGNATVCAGWYLPDGTLAGPGSYFYDGWSRIDNFFAAGTARILSLCAETDGPWFDAESQRPHGYKIWTGSGYSDHLPVTCVVQIP